MTTGRQLALAALPSRYATPPGRVLAEVDSDARRVAEDCGLEVLNLDRLRIAAIEDRHGSIGSWLEHHGVPAMSGWLPYGHRGGAISLHEDVPCTAAEYSKEYQHDWRREPAEYDGQPMTVDRSLNLLALRCHPCQTVAVYSGHDDGADAAGLDMLRHVLDNPKCSGLMSLLPWRVKA